MFNVEVSFDKPKKIVNKWPYERAQNNIQITGALSIKF